MCLNLFINFSKLRANILVANFDFKFFLSKNIFHVNEHFFHSNQHFFCFFVINIFIKLFSLQVFWYLDKFLERYKKLQFLYNNNISMIFFYDIIYIIRTKYISC